MDPAIQIKTLVEPDIDDNFDAAICALQQKAFPSCELFKNSRFYVHKPRRGDLRVLAMCKNQLIAQVVVYQAEAKCQDQAISLACLGNVCSDPDFRGTGAAAACIETALDHSSWADRQWAMLFCRDEVAGYYARWGFERIDNELFVTAPNQQPRKYPKDDFAMVKPLAGQNMDSWPTAALVMDIDIF